MSSKRQTSRLIGVVADSTSEANSRLFLNKRMKLKPRSMGLLAMFGLVDPSRIYGGHHFPTDAAGSYLLGTDYVIELIALYDQARARELRAEW